MLGALLAGGIIFLALGSFRSAFVDVTTIPLALLSALVALWASGQTINLMTLGGLTLAIGILVDESVIAVENIHRHLGDRKPVARAVLSASGEVVVPRLLIMLSILAVFAPSFFLAGVARAMFVPLALAVGFAMVASFFLASTFVPIVETWLQPGAGTSKGMGEERIERIRERYAAWSRRALARRGAVLVGYLAVSAAAMMVLLALLGKEIFPSVDSGLLQMRLRAPVGTRVERTEQLVQDVLAAIDDEIGAEKVASRSPLSASNPPPIRSISSFCGREGRMRRCSSCGSRKARGSRPRSSKNSFARGFLESCPGPPSLSRRRTS